MNCMMRTTYCFLRVHVENIFLSLRKKFSHVWEHMSPDKGTYVRRPTNLCSQANEPMFISHRTYVLQKPLFLMEIAGGQSRIDEGRSLLK